MQDLNNTLVICSVENCLGPNLKWLPSDLAAIRLYRAMGGKLLLFTRNAPEKIFALWRQAELVLPVIAWDGACLFDWREDRICGGNAFSEQEQIQGLVGDLMEAFPSLGISILAQNGKLYLPRMNRTAHACLRDEKSAYLVGELHHIPQPWYQINLYPNAPETGRLKEYLSQKKPPEIRCTVKDFQIELLSEEAQPENTVRQLCEHLKLSLQQTLWIGCDTVSQSLLAEMMPPIVTRNADEALWLSAHHRLPVQCEGCVGETLYKLCKGSF